MVRSRLLRRTSFSHLLALLSLRYYLLANLLEFICFLCFLDVLSSSPAHRFSCFRYRLCMYEYIGYVEVCRGARFTCSIGMNISAGIRECVRTLCGVRMAYHNWYLGAYIYQVCMYLVVMFFLRVCITTTCFFTVYT